MSTEAGGTSGTTRAALPAWVPEPGGDPGVPARVPGVSRAAGLVARWKQSAWAPVVARTAGVLAGMLTLSAIGAASLTMGTGVPVAVAAPSAVPSASSAAQPNAVQPPATVSPSAPTTSVAGSWAGLTADGKVILNMAAAEDLQKLPRVGAKRAAAILELRTKLGRFRSTTDLLRVRGIGRKTLQLLLPRIVVDAPKEGH